MHGKTCIHHLSACGPYTSLQSKDRMMLVYFLGKEAQDIEQAKIIPTKWQVSGFEHKRFLRLGISVFACL